jgi:UDP-GlcNAc:undecaprenyl-phosphate/decaprenyl-phosphate GlcNAc-1-phosphate transferase
MIRYAGAFALSFVFALWWTPIMRSAALQLGLLDAPDGKLKNHANAVPYLGGLAVYVAFLLTAGVFTDFGIEALGLLLAGTIALIVGLIDDFGVLTPHQKLLGQALAALVLVRAGIYIKLSFLPWWVAIPLTVLWILTIVNAINIIDILDGLATGVAAVAAAAIAVANFMAGRHSVALFSIVLCGALLGFLRHNFCPAKIYLGDTGSLFIGFMLASLSMNAGYTRVNDLAAISPVLILGVPLFDLALVIFIRFRKGIPVMKGSPDHFAIRLRRAGLSVRETAVFSYLAGFLLAGAALLMTQVPFEWAAGIVAAMVVAAGLSTFLLLKVNMTA